MNRRRFFSVGALAPLALAQHEMRAASGEVFDVLHDWRDPIFFGEQVIALRLEEDGSTSTFNAWVNGRVWEPRNCARDRREDLGADHWSLLAFVPIAGYDEDYYEQYHVAVDLAYWDDERLAAKTVDGSIRTFNTSHVSDPGAGLHRWAFPDEDWRGIEWKHTITSVEPTFHFEQRRRHGDQKTWMWV